MKGDGSSAKNMVFFTAVSVVCFLLASSVLPFFDVFGKLPCPDILFCLCCILPKFCDVKKCCIFALSLGFLSDLFINTPHCFSPAVYLAAVVLVPYFYSFLKGTGTVAAAVCSIPAIALKGIFGAVTVTAIRKGVLLWDMLGKNVLPEIIVNLAFVLIIGFVLKLLTKFFGVQKESTLF